MLILSRNFRLVDFEVVTAKNKGSKRLLSASERLLKCTTVIDYNNRYLLQLLRGCKGGASTLIVEHFVFGSWMT